MDKLQICVDIDGTVTEPFYWLDRANAHFKANLRPEDVVKYEIHELLGVEEEDYMRFYREQGRLLHREARVRLGAREAVSRLHSRHSIHFVTARHPDMEDVSREWLSRHKFPMDSLHHLASHDKVEKARELEADFFIEDSLSNALQLGEAGFQVLLLDCSYNRHAPLPETVLRVGHWFQILRTIGDWDRLRKRGATRFRCR
ncbi:5' nucleotidase, NT5C type [Anaerotalea alkaliphila]|uniref:Nucleotidase n=1 Tax=Anaerotalea alkaliphila TaxID=2662126 RepID=A0A7X5HVI8_9FIRM|nr:hypothetical protein [Anaerotalea alkaliphila]NDL67430.1 hypothetical protein [Anaerotalea alkaliphila]